MLRVRHLCCVVLLFATSGFAQSFPETDALVDVFLAKDIDSALRHLPTEWEKYVSDLDGRERRAITPLTLFANDATPPGAKYIRPEEGAALLVQEFSLDQKKYRIEYSLEKRISNGYESMLRLNVHNSEVDSRYDVSLQVLMRFEEGEWRIYELQPPYSREKLDLSTPDLIERVRNASIGENESAAIATLGTLSCECSRGGGIAGVVDPPPVADSSESEPEEPVQDEAHENQSTLETVELRPEPVLDMTTGPLEKDGYRFTYEPGFSMDGNDPVFRIVARPLEFGRTGSINFFVDQTRVVRYTRENREATADDPEFRTNRSFMR